jgi:hypothetical protein
VYTIEYLLLFMNWPPLTTSVPECPSLAIIEPPPAPPSPPAPELDELELELEEDDVDIPPAPPLPVEPVGRGVVVSSEQDAASAARSTAINHTAAGLVFIIHCLADRATRRSSEQRLFLENKCEILQARLPAPNSVGAAVRAP